MPSTYTHFRFGSNSLLNLEDTVRSMILRNRRLFDVGQHGPDLFFYYNPVASTAIGNLGGAFHQQSGRTFFTNALFSLGPTPSEAALVYLWGVLGHFTLDSLCHPYINECVGQGLATHSSIEAELDRFFLEADGKVPAPAQRLTGHLHLSKEDCGQIAPIYPPATDSQIHACVNRMRLFLDLLTAPKGFKRFAMLRLTRLANANAYDMIMQKEPLASCRLICQELEKRFSQAVTLYPKLFAELEAYRKALFANSATNAERCSHLLSSAFDPTFG